MKYFSTNNNCADVSFEDAVLKGLAEDGGLYMPEYIPQISSDLIKNLDSIPMHEIAFEIAKPFVGDEIPEEDLREIIESAINFKAPLVSLSDNLNILELFHGPTLAFKDFGARFMARTMEYFVKKSNKELNILVATSGDTGSAVANGFYGVEGINVFILYPSGKVSYIQEKQLTTLDKNVIALEIDGTFDDCQRMVKEAFVDKGINAKLNLSSANSINIARLLPQSFYYFEAYKQIADKSKEIVVCVPSGNLGNITAGLLAKKMGLPLGEFIGATNANTVFREFIETGKFTPRPSVKTYSNAMDVGNPSNLARIMSAYNDSINSIRDDIFSFSFSDDDTVNEIKMIYQKYDYVIDPHGAVGVLALEKYFTQKEKENKIGIVLETAHPAKFKDIVDPILNIDLEIPDRLRQCLDKEKKSIKISNSYEDLKMYLLNN